MLEEVGQEDVSLGTNLNSGPFLDHPSYLQRSEEQPPHCHNVLPKHMQPSSHGLSPLNL